MSNYEVLARYLNIPVEISEFLLKLFEIYEIRGVVGTYKSIKFEIRSKETPHNNPHVHASYGEFSISIDIVTFEVTGKMLSKKQKYAVKWVKQNQKNLLEKWREIKVNSKMPYTNSALSFDEEKV